MPVAKVYDTETGTWIPADQPQLSALSAPPEVSTFAATLPPIRFSDPVVQDIDVYRGDSGRFRVTVTDIAGNPVDVSAATWDCDIRIEADAATTVGQFEVVPVAGSTNKIDVIMSAALSASLSGGPYVYDLEMTMSGEVITLIRGTITVIKDVSRTP